MEMRVGSHIPGAGKSDLMYYARDGVDGGVLIDACSRSCGWLNTAFSAIILHKRPYLHSRTDVMNELECP